MSYSTRIVVWQVNQYNENGSCMIFIYSVLSQLNSPVRQNDICHELLRLQQNASVPLLFTVENHSKARKALSFVNCFVRSTTESMHSVYTCKIRFTVRGRMPRWGLHFPANPCMTNGASVQLRSLIVQFDVCVGMMWVKSSRPWDCSSGWSFGFSVI